MLFILLVCSLSLWRSVFNVLLAKFRISMIVSVDLWQKCVYWHLAFVGSAEVVNLLR